MCWGEKSKLEKDGKNEEHKWIGVNNHARERA